MEGRHRAVVPGELLALTCDKSGHDPGDECRYWSPTKVTNQ